MDQSNDSPFPDDLEEDSGPDLLADLLDEARRGMEKGESTAEVAHRVWPLFKAAVIQAMNESDEAQQIGVQDWLRRRGERSAEA